MEQNLHHQGGGGNQHSLNITLLKNGAEEISKWIHYDDKYPDLWKSLSSHVSSQYSTPDEHQLFINDRKISFPEILVEQFNEREFSSFKGIFPEINRVWIAVDNHLVLWNYKDGGDIATYDNLDQLIISVGLVKPKTDIFVNEVKYLLAVTTPVEIVLLAIIFKNNDINSELQIHPTKYSIPTDNVNMLKIIGTDNGRIFMCGRDGCIYEFDYKSDDTWFSKKCKKLNHTKTRISYLLPSFLRFTSGDSIIEAVVDNSRNILYTLSQNSIITVFDLGQKCDIMKRVNQYATLRKDAITYCPSLQDWDYKNLQFIGIATISVHESNAVHLVAITNTGMRVYFSTMHPSGFLSPLLVIPRPQGLFPIHFRFPPNVLLPDPTENLNRPLQVSGKKNDISIAYYKQGITIMSNSTYNNITNELICICPDISRTLIRSDSTHHGSMNLYEKAFNIPIDETIWQINEVVVPPYYSNNHHNELGQSSYLPRQFLCLTDTGIYVVWKLRPVDELREILLRSNGSDTQELRDFFFEKYGRAEACAMCLDIICSKNFDSSHSVLSSQWKNSKLAEYATSAFFSYGGEPTFEYQRQTHAQPTRVVFSGTHDGLALYYSRLIRQIWSDTVFEHKKTNMDEGEFFLKLSPSLLRVLQMNLRHLDEFLERIGFAKIKIEQSTSPKRVLRQQLLEFQKKRQDSVADRIEKNSLSNIHMLLKRSLEIFSLLAFLNQYCIPPVSQRKLTLRFRDFVSSPDGVELAKDLANSLIKEVENVSSLEGLVKSLCDLCPTLFNRSDQDRFEGFKYLNEANACYINSPEEAKLLLQKSLEKFLAIPQNINEHNMLIEICKHYKFHKFYNGIIVLSLECARSLDPSNLALKFYKESIKMPSLQHDNEEKLLYDSRIACYGPIIDALEQLSNGKISNNQNLTKNDIENLKVEVYKSAKNSTDELFHYVLYQWFLDKNLKKDLTMFDTPYIETYLKDICPNKSLSTELLWRYYVRNHKFSLATYILDQTAQKEGNDLNLQDRIGLLTKALMNAKSSMTTSEPLDGEYVQSLESKLQVAKIQSQIYNDMDTYKPDIASQAKVELDSKLFTLTELYNYYAGKYGLCEAALAIFHCGGHNDPALVQLLWTNIIEDIINSDQPYHKLYNKILSLGKFYPSDIIFPLDFICDKLELITLAMKDKTIGDWQEGWVIKVMREIGVPFSSLFDVYYNLLNKTIQSGEASNRIHFVKTICNLLEDWSNYAISPLGPNQYDIKSFYSKKIDSAIDSIKQHIPKLDPNYNQLETKLNRIKKRINES